MNRNIPTAPHATPPQNDLPSGLRRLRLRASVISQPDVAAGSVSVVELALAAF